MKARVSVHMCVRVYIPVYTHVLALYYMCIYTGIYVCMSAVLIYVCVWVHIYTIHV